MVVVGSLFEGLGEDIATSVSQYVATPTAVILYDLIPLVFKDMYFPTTSATSDWYYKKLEQLKQAELLLAISESSGSAAVNLLGIAPDRVANISAGVDAHFQPRPVSPQDIKHFREVYGLTGRFIMYTGGIDLRKNIDGLIRAYARLGKMLRSTHQLAIVCAIQPEERSRLENLGASIGLASGEVVMTGYVPENDLLALYNGCTLFVFPSLHEGFGLPIVEAMQCGKAVIASNTSSLPEVVGRTDALFDPHDESAIAAKMQQALEDDVFRAELERHGPAQAARFTWDETAQRAISAIEKAVEREATTAPALSGKARKRLAYISPLPPERSGISAYSTELLPMLHKWYDIDVVNDQTQVDDAWISAHCKLRNVAWFRAHSGEFDRVLYHFGNSAFHQHMFDLLQEIPGVVVLHDFFMSGVKAWRGIDLLLKALQRSHGYRAVLDHFKSPSDNFAIWTYPANLAVLQNAIGMIVHSENSRRLADQWYGAGASADWDVIPHLRAPSFADDVLRKEARRRIEVPEDALLLCSFGILGPMKLNDRLISAFMRSKLASNSNVYLIFVGENQDNAFGWELSETISQSGLNDRIRITGWCDTEKYNDHLNAGDVAIQLRCLSRGESSGTVLDCMGSGLATLVNAHGSLADIDRDCVIMLPDQFEDGDLITALETLAFDPSLRQTIADKGRRYIQEEHSPEKCAAKYADAIEKFHDMDTNGLGGLIRTLSREKFEANFAPALAKTLSRNFPPKPRLRQLLVDVSELVQRDVRTGIQRVVRAILLQWLMNPPEGWCVEPVFATAERRGYFYARRFTCDFLGIEKAWAEDVAVDAWSGDIFIGLDLQPIIVPEQKEILEAWWRAGVDVRFVVYDLLPVLRPDCFVDGASAMQIRWLEFISRFSGAVCISRAVADELRVWLNDHAATRTLPFAVDWFHLGADLMNTGPTRGLPADALVLQKKLRKAPTFLMVGTIEPRKGHRQTLAAFERLWSEGVEANLVVIGKQGWHVEELIDRIANHAESGKRLHWLQSISDEYLELIYAASSCLIFASEGEGFGLPLIEAAQHKLPIIARDLPVFREIAGEHAFYFDGLRPDDLAAALTAWLGLYRENKQIRSDDIAWLTWEQSADMLLQRLGGRLATGPNS